MDHEDPDDDPPTLESDPCNIVIYWIALALAVVILYSLIGG